MFAPHIARAPPPPAPHRALATASPTTALQRPTPSLTTSDRNALVRGRHTNNPRPYSASPDRSHHAASRARHVPSPSSVIPSVHRPQAPRRQRTAATYTGHHALKHARIDLPRSVLLSRTASRDSVLLSNVSNPPRPVPLTTRFSPRRAVRVCASHRRSALKTTPSCTMPHTHHVHALISPTESMTSSRVHSAHACGG
jgi:hypothetical protein